MTEITIIAAMDPNGVIGRTSKPCDGGCSGGTLYPAPVDMFAGALPEICGRCHGRDHIPANDLPWGRAYPEDLARFKVLTMGTPDSPSFLAMGRRTWLSIGRPLPGRSSAIVSTTQEQPTPGAWVFRSLDALLAQEHGEHSRLFVIGGARLFAEALPLATRFELTLIGREYEGDVRFPMGELFANPRISELAWNSPGGDVCFKCVSREPCPTNADLTFTTWVRR